MFLFEKASFWIWNGLARKFNYWSDSSCMKNANSISAEYMSLEIVFTFYSSASFQFIRTTRATYWSLVRVCFAAVRGEFRWHQLLSLVFASEYTVLGDSETLTKPLVSGLTDVDDHIRLALHELHFQVCCFMFFLCRTVSVWMKPTGEGTKSTMW